MNFRKLLSLLGVVALVSLTVSHGSAKEYELDVTMDEDGWPSEFFYADERMSVRITPDVPLIEYDGTATVEVIVDEAFDPQILRSTSFRYYVLGVTIPLDPNAAFKVKQVELKTPHHLIIRGFKLRAIPSQYSKHGTCDLKIVQLPRTVYPKVIDGFTPRWSIDPIADEMEIAKALDLLLGPWFAQRDVCVESLEVAREKEKEKQASLDDIEARKETIAQEEDILLLTNQRLLECAFDPACEKKLLEGVERCKETVRGGYVESCIRAIDVSP